ncbi:hypothetical protein Bpfe_024423, partial [Biomphalaria pfeifferi]
MGQQGHFCKPPVLCTAYKPLHSSQKTQHISRGTTRSLLQASNSVYSIQTFALQSKDTTHQQRDNK